MLLPALPLPPAAEPAVISPRTGELIEAEILRGLGMGPAEHLAPREELQLQQHAAATIQRAARAWSWRALLADVERDASSLVQRAWRRALNRRAAGVSVDAAVVVEAPHRLGGLGAPGPSLP